MELQLDSRRNMHRKQFKSNLLIRNYSKFVQQQQKNEDM